MPIQEKRQRGRPRLVQPPSDAAGSIQTLDRAIVLLGLVAQGSGLSLTEAANAAGLPLSTAYRMLATLQRHGMVEFEPTAQLWHIGVETFRMGASFLRRRKLADRGRQVMQELVARSGETANIAVADADAVVFVSQVETHEAIRAFFRPGTRSPFHVSGVGKAILAYLPAEQATALLRRYGLQRFTERTITELAALLRDLDTIRTRGWAIDDEERNLGMRCVGSAIFNEFAEPIAGISLSGPTVRMTPETLDRLGPLVREAAAEISRLIAGRAP